MRRPFSTAVVTGLALLVASARSPAQPPTQGEVVVPAAAGWRAFQIHTSEGGVWYAHVAEVVPALGPPEVIVCDDAGQFVVLSVYSGKWTPHTVVCDGQWLAPSRPADVDPRVPGTELYAGGKGGNVHRITLEPRPFSRFELRSVEIGHAAGEEFHTVLAADLVQERAGDELWAFAISGALFELRPAGDADAFTMRRIADLPGRVRDAVVLSERGGEGVRVVAVSRSGHLLQLRGSGAGVEHEVLAHEDTGLGRLARWPRRGAGGAEVLYVTRDDGVLLRLQEDTSGAWQREVIFAGSQGLRGVATGRFHDDGREAVAVYGYGKRVQVVSRSGEGPWEVETIFGSSEQGHWLAVGELDGRNGTDELVATTFGGRVILLGRPAGYGLEGAAVDRGDDDG